MKTFFFILIFSIPIYSQTLYVSPNGNNENGDGTINNPYLTIQKALIIQLLKVS